MEILESVSIPRMFSAYGYAMKTYTQHGGTFRVVQYYCLACKTSFSATWRYTGALHAFKDSNVVCPQCGKHHVSQYNLYVIRHLDENEAAPVNMRLTVVEGKDFVSLKVSAQTIRFTELWHIIDAELEEEFRFDIKARKTIFKRKVYGRLTDEFELGDPFDRRVFYVSILYFLTSDSAAVKQSEALSRILKTLRETLRKRLETRCKHKIKSMYVSCGSAHGRLLFPLYNMAFRTVFLDAPNLPAPYKDKKRSVEYFWNTHDVDDNDRFKDLKYFRKKNNYISALIELYALPDVRSVRKILQQDFFAFRLLQIAKMLTNNIDYLTAAYPLLLRLCTYAHNNFYANSSFKDICQFCAEMAPVYGVVNVLRLLDSDMAYGGYYLIRDIASMYHQLSAANRELLPAVKFSNLHDWLSVKIEEQRKVGVAFEVPEPIRRRLMMQKDSIRFFLPAKSTELSAAGRELHNCVGSYTERMAANTTQVVLVADDNGKLAACLEIVNETLVQAKLKYNKPVAKNAKINAEVTDWAEKVGITIQTSDVRKIYLPAVVAAV